MQIVGRASWRTVNTEKVVVFSVQRTRGRIGCHVIGQTARRPAARFRQRHAAQRRADPEKAEPRRRERHAPGPCPVGGDRHVLRRRRHDACIFLIENFHVQPLPGLRRVSRRGKHRLRPRRLRKAAVRRIGRISREHGRRRADGQNRHPCRQQPPARLLPFHRSSPFSIILRIRSYVPAAHRSLRPPGRRTVATVPAGTVNVNRQVPSAR